MYASCYLVTDAQLKELKQDASIIHQVISEAYEDNDPERCLQLGKAWYWLHFLFTGSIDEGDPPLNFLMDGGRVVGDIDVGFGPARSFTRKQVAEIAQALDALTIERLLERVDLDVFEVLYPGRKIDLSSTDDLNYWFGDFFEVGELAQLGAKNKMGMLVWVD